MARPVTLFTGQWADLPFEAIAKKAGAWGFDGLELACWGDHFDAEKALEKDSYVREKKDILTKNKLKCFAISTHLIGQCVCDPIDERHKSVLPERLWGDGKPEGVRQRCAEELKKTARAAKLLGVDVVNGFTGSSVWGSFISSLQRARRTSTSGTRISRIAGPPSWTSSRSRESDLPWKSIPPRSLMTSSRLTGPWTP